MNLIYNRYLKNIKPMEEKTLAVEKKLWTQTACYLCNEEFTTEDGKSRGKAHANHNIIPFFFYCSYDFHLLIIVKHLKWESSELLILKTFSDE